MTFLFFWGGWYYRYRCTRSFCEVSIDIHRVFLRCMLGGCTRFRCGRAPASDERVLAVGQTFGGFQWFSMDTPASTDALNHPTIQYIATSKSDIFWDHLRHFHFWQPIEIGFQVPKVCERRVHSSDQGNYPRNLKHQGPPPADANMDGTRKSVGEWSNDTTSNNY